MKQIAKVIDFMEKLEFQGYIANPIQIETDDALSDELPYKTWISLRGMPIMKVKDVLDVLGVKEHPLLTYGFIEKNNRAFCKQKQRRKWRDSRAANYREELYLLRYLKKHPEPFVAVDIYVVVESKNEQEQVEDSAFIQGKICAARLSSIPFPQRGKKDTRLPLIVCVKRQEGDDQK